MNILKRCLLALLICSSAEAQITKLGLPKSGGTMLGAISWAGTNYVGLWAQQMTTAQRDAIDPLVDGMTIYNTDDDELQVVAGGVWTSAGGGGGAGTVTSVNASGGTTGLTFSGGPITGSGTLTLSGTLGVPNGGTGLTLFTQGDILYASGASTLAKLAAVATGNVLLSGGVNTAPSWGKVDLGVHVTGQLTSTNMNLHRAFGSADLDSIYFNLATQLYAMRLEIGNVDVWRLDTTGQMETRTPGTPIFSTHPYALYSQQEDNELGIVLAVASATGGRPRYIGMRKRAPEFVGAGGALNNGNVMVDIEGWGYNGTSYEVGGRFGISSINAWNATRRAAGFLLQLIDTVGSAAIQNYMTIGTRDWEWFGKNATDGFTYRWHIPYDLGQDIQVTWDSANGTVMQYSSMTDGTFPQYDAADRNFDPVPGTQLTITQGQIPIAVDENTLVGNDILTVDTGNIQLNFGDPTNPTGTFNFSKDGSAGAVGTSYSGATLFIGERAGGNQVTPTALANNAQIVSLTGKGYNGSAMTGPWAEVRITSLMPGSDLYTADRHGAQIGLYTTDTTSGATLTRRVNVLHNRMILETGVDLTSQDGGFIGNVDIATGAVDSVKLTNGGVSSTDIRDGGIVNADIANSAAVSALKVSTGIVANGEFDFLDGVTSNIQDQLDALAPSDDPIFTNSVGLPHGAGGTTVDAAGEVTINTTAPGAVQFHDGTAERALPSLQFKSFVIIAATATSDYKLWKSPYAITIISVNCLATGGTSVTGGVDEADGNGTLTAAVDADITATAGTNAADDGSLTNPSIDSGDYVNWHTTSVSGTNTDFTVTIAYQVTPP